MSLLEIRNLTIGFGSKNGAVTVVEDFSLSLVEGETVALVGESGSGKTVTALSIARLLPTPPVLYPKGEILVEGRDTLLMGKKELRSIRGRVVSYIFQEPGASLNPVLRIGSQIIESLQLHQPAKATKSRMIELLKLVGIPAPETRLSLYPHQLSGGMQQRVMIAMALASEPRLLIADEPTTALDVTIQAQILDLLLELKQRFGMSLLLITHNLAMLGNIADRVAVMYAGQVVETGPARSLLATPNHPYTQSLLTSVPKLNAGSRSLVSIPGSVPSPAQLPSGCRFHPRCFKAQTDCPERKPDLFRTTSGEARCFYWDKPVSRTLPPVKE